VLAQDGGGAEADLGGQALDRELSRLEQALGAAHARASDPGSRRGADLLAEASAERAGAHAGAAGHDRESQVAVQVLLEPGQEWRHRAPVVGR
jgi:hypothetical protein